MQRGRSISTIVATRLALLLSREGQVEVLPVRVRRYNRNTADQSKIGHAKIWDEERDKRRTALGVVEDQLVEDTGEERRGDAHQRGYGSVVPARRVLAEQRQRGEAAAEIASSVRRETDWGETPDKDTAAEQRGVKRADYIIARITVAYYANAMSQGIVLGVERWLAGSLHEKITSASTKSCRRGGVREPVPECMRGGTYANEFVERDVA